jgi:predicted transcriptional regulator
MPRQNQESASTLRLAMCGTDALRAKLPLEEAFSRMQQCKCSTLPVVREGQLVGVLTLENIGEWVMVQTALERQSDEPA